jgi:SAM-dependent methyltransferase
MDFNERVIPGVSSNFMFKEALARYEFAKKYIKSDMCILDLGSGTGYGTSVLGADGVRVLGIDINSEAVNFSNKHYASSNVEFKKGDILSKLPKDEYDLVTSFEVIEHLKNPVLFLKNINSSLKKNGVFIMSTPNASIISPTGGVGSPYHTKEFDYDELNKMLRKNFREVTIFGQFKSKKAISAWSDFLKSQKVRESSVKRDLLGIRKFIPKELKEFIWKYLGNFYGRKTQETLDTKDFPIHAESVKLAFYFVAVCVK